VARLGLLALAVAELLYLTTRFDTVVFDHAASPWLQVMAWSPQYLKIAITVGVVLLLLGVRSGRLSLPSAGTVSNRSRAIWLALHLVAFGLFAGVSTLLFDLRVSEAHPALWVTAWGLSGLSVVATLAKAFGVVRLPYGDALGGWLTAGAALLLGIAAWAGGLLTETLWVPLARMTFRAVGAALHLIYPEVVSRPETLVLGTPSFKVQIAPSCSGYEGIGLILTFLTVYFWLNRKELRFPGALVLLPIGAVTMWVVNVVRLVVLIAIGTAGAREIALGGFHSQAGWLAFNAVGLALVALLNHGRYFSVDAQVAEGDAGLKTRATRSGTVAPDPTTAYLLPFLVVIATAMVTGAFSAGIDWLYPLRVIAAAGVLWVFRKQYTALGWTLSWRAVAIGCLTFAVWVALVPADAAGASWPAALATVPVHWAAAWLVVRVVGYTITVPLVEELAFRAYLTRRLIDPDFERLPVGLFTWSSFLVSSLLFGALHGGYWLAGTLAGMTFALALYQRRSLGDAVVAHATTNGLIAVYVLATGRWGLWA
jgi:exosortase E/protease (VPEID-CTERM system)